MKKILLFILISISCSVARQSQAQNTEWNSTNGTVSVSEGQMTFTSYVAGAHEHEVQHYMAHMDFSVIFEDLKKEHPGGIITSSIAPDGEVILKIYAYKKNNPDGKGNLIYGCKSTEEGLQEDHWMVPKEDFIIPNGIKDFVVPLKTDVKSTNIVQMAEYNEIYIPEKCITHKAKEKTSHKALLGTGAGSIGAAIGIAALASNPAGWALAGAAAFFGGDLIYHASTDSSPNTPVARPTLECKRFGTPIQPVIVELTVKNATVQSFNIPGGKVHIKPIDIFLNEMPEPTIKVYKYDFASQTKGTPIGQSLDGSDIDLSAAALKLGDSLIFEITPYAHFPKPPNIKGVPGVWIATDDEDVRYYCTPSVTPGEYKPFLPYDHAIHKIAINQYPDGFDPKEKDWSINGGTYSWGYTLQRRMDAGKTEYEPQFSWQMAKDLNALFGENAKIYNAYTKRWDNHQRNAKKSGLNMQYLYANLADDKKYILGPDSDEITYIDCQSYDPNDCPGAKLFSLSDAKNGAYEVWKSIGPFEVEPLHLLVSNYRYHKLIAEGKDPESYEYGYDGYEIEDWGTYRKRDQPGGMCDGANCEYNAYGWDDLFASGAPLNGQTRGENKAPGLIKIYSGSNPVAINLNVTSDLTQNGSGTRELGFYEAIEGTQWPGAHSTGNSYKLKGLKGLSDSELRKYSLELAEHPNGGQSIVVKETLSLKDADPASLQAIRSSGHWSVVFSKGGYKFMTVTAYYQSHENGERVIVAGKEITGSIPAFISVPGSEYEESAASQSTTLPGTDYVDLKEGLGSFPKWYYREDLSHSPYYGQSRYGRVEDKFGRTYTFTKDSKVVFAASDKDNQRYRIYGDPPNGWYMSERYSAKRIPDDTLALAGYAKWTVSPVDIDGDINGGPVASGTGRYFDYTWDSLGQYELKYTYRNSPDIVRYLINIVGYDYDEEMIKLGPSGGLEHAEMERSQKADIKIYELTPHEKAWLGLNGGDYKVAEITDVLSEYMYLSPVEGGGPRGSYNPNTGRHNEPYNRFGKYNDYASEYIWKSARNEGGAPSGSYWEVLNPGEVDQWMTNYENIRKLWFPSNWVRHHSEKMENMSELQGHQISGSYDEHQAEFDQLFANSPIDQSSLGRFLELYWIQYTHADGYLIRNDKKFVGNLERIFDPTDGAWTGQQAHTYEKRKLFQEASKLPAMEAQFNIPGLPTISSGSVAAGDILKDQYNLFMDLKNGRKVIIKGDEHFYLEVYSKGYRNYHDLTHQVNDEEVFMADMTALYNLPTEVKGTAFRTKTIVSGEHFAEITADNETTADEYYTITSVNDRVKDFQFTAPIEQGGNDFFLKLKVPVSGGLYVAAATDADANAIFTYDGTTKTTVPYLSNPHDLNDFTAESNKTVGATLPSIQYNGYRINAAPGTILFIEGNEKGPFVLSKTITVPKVEMNDANKYFLDKQLAFSNGQKTMVCPHRGFWLKSDVAENTIAAYEEALNLGADMLEADVLTTHLADGSIKFVMYHDHIPFRMTNYDALNQYKFEYDATNQLYWGPEMSKFKWDATQSNVPVFAGHKSITQIGTTSVGAVQDMELRDILGQPVLDATTLLPQKVELLEDHLDFIKGNNSRNAPILTGLDRTEKVFDKVYKEVLLNDAENYIFFKYHSWTAAQLNTRYGDLMKQIIFTPSIHPESSVTDNGCVQSNTCIPKAVGQIFDDFEAMSTSKGWTIPAYEMHLKTTKDGRHNSVTAQAYDEMVKRISVLKSRNKWVGVTQQFPNTCRDISEYRRYDNCTPDQSISAVFCSNFDRRPDFDFSVDFVGHDYFNTDNALVLLEFLRVKALHH